MRNPGTCFLCISMSMILGMVLSPSSGYKLGRSSGNLEGETGTVRLAPELVPSTSFISSRAARWDAEPSCDELRAMWHFSKRQSRATEMTNELPTYRDPFAYNVWDDYAAATSRSAGGRAGGSRSRSPTLVYGRVIHAPPRSRTRIAADRNYEEVAARLIGTGSQLNTDIPRRKVSSFRTGGSSIPIESQYGIVTPASVNSFQQVKDLIRSERARELQEQRLHEEELARAAALRGLGPTSYYGHIVREPPNKYEAMRYGNYDKSMSLNQRKGSPLAFPDLLAPTSAKYTDQFYRHRSYQEPGSV